MAQISTTGQLENASKEIIDAVRYTAEHNAPVWGTARHFTLPKGHDTLVTPKVGQMTVRNLTEGEDMVDEEEIGMSTNSTTPGEVGGKIILSDKLLRQNMAVSFQMVGKQLGDAMKRKREEDLIALFTALNGGTNFGAAGAEFSAANATSCVSTAKTDKMGEDMVIIHHPNAVMRLARDLSTVGSGQIRPLPEGFSARILGKAFRGYQVWDVPVLETGNISRDSSDDAIGVIMEKNGALATLQSLAPGMERERDASLRAWEVNFVSDYSVFELDDSLGAGLTYDAADPSTSA
tara:strand:+ start:3445 stop:4320 length:876 start_codon:yes stop_codon:yes gene_type:complete